jgi:hypothetical protein
MAGALALTFERLLPVPPVLAADRRNVRIKVEFLSDGRLDVEGWINGSQETCTKTLSADLLKDETVTYDPGAPDVAVWIEEGILVKVEAQPFALPQVTLRHGGTFTAVGCQAGGKTVFQRKKLYIDEETLDRRIDRDPRIFRIRIDREPNVNEDIVILVRVNRH